MCKWTAQRAEHGAQAVGTDKAERDGNVGGMRWGFPRGVNCTGWVIRAAPSNF